MEHRLDHRLSRAGFIRLAAASAFASWSFAPARSQDDEITRESIYDDPEAPSAGNPRGDLTIVDFFDYNCPYCKASAPHLERLVKTDGNIRLVYRDWPVLAPTSIIGARLALAAKYQGKYQAAHDAMMAIPGYGIASQAMTDAVRRSGVDMARLLSDEKTHAAEIGALIRRNLAIADLIGLQGTPRFLVGPFRVNQALDYDAFAKAAADARARQKAAPKG